MKCADCKWYFEKTSEMNDECHHVKAQWRSATGIGVRTEVTMSEPIYYSCKSMLAGICTNHELFEPKQSTHDDKDDRVLFNEYARTKKHLYKYSGTC